MFMLMKSDHKIGIMSVMNGTEKKPVAARNSRGQQPGELWNSKSEEAEKLETMLVGGKIPNSMTVMDIIKAYPEYARFKYPSIRSFIAKVRDTHSLNLELGK